MSKLTAQEIIDKLKEACDNEVSNFAHEEYDSAPFGVVECVSSKGGMDKGSDWRRVFYFKEHDVYLQVKGWYASHDGTYFEEGWDCVTEVTPKEKTITVYE